MQIYIINLIIMEDVFLQMIVTFIIWYLLYIIISVFFLTTIVYFTYRFWKMILPKEENNIFISNAPMVWYKNNISNEDED